MVKKETERQSFSVPAIHRPSLEFGARIEVWTGPGAPQAPRG